VLWMSSTQRARDGAPAVPQDDGGESRAPRPARRSPPASHPSGFEAGAEWRPLGWADPGILRRARTVRAVEQRLAHRLRRPIAVDVDIEGRGGQSDRMATSAATALRSAMAAMAIMRVERSILRGRPPIRPRARAAARPAMVRSAISSLSNSAKAAKIPNAKRPLAVVVSICAPAPASTFSPRRGSADLRPC
jgi:hypothetical protein